LCNTPQFLFPFIHWWTPTAVSISWLLWVVLSLSLQGSAHIFTRWLFHLFWVCVQRRDGWVIYSSSFNFLRQLQTVFPNCCTNLHPPNSAQGFIFCHAFTSTCYFLSCVCVYVCM
jgi:hypothetical protein